MDTFASRLRAVREARGWSQEKLGIELDVTGATISKWETGRSEPSLANLEIFLRIFARDNVTLDWLIAGGKAGAASSKPRKSAPPSPKTAESQDELALLARYRRLPPKKQTALLGLLED
ncbi:helix-turn-helix domain-containing protein [Lysobacter rhizosphaerae]